MSEEIITTATGETPEQLYEKLVAEIRKYYQGDLSLVEKAYRVAAEAHKDQMRRSGEPYIIHPLCVGIILAELEMDMESIIGGILHDVVEDTDVTLPDVQAAFGDEIAQLVDGVTKLGSLHYFSDKAEEQAENLRKMFLAMAKDIRVLIIKLADRTHNMRTLQYMKKEKQLEKAKETMDIYAPLASRLGISKLKIELDNLALKYSKPEAYKELVEAVDRRKLAREEFIERIVKEVQGHLDQSGIRADVKGRVKHYFSIYRKMMLQDKTVDEIYDLFAIRILVPTVQDCYAVLGLIHDLYTPVPGRFKDYIAMPKPNRYQSLHTTLIGKDGQPFEVQIRTYEMHRVAEYGVAAHWKYKEDGSVKVTGDDEKMSWLRQILEWQHDLSDDHEFLNTLKTDLTLFSENVYCFTPGGDVKVLPKGSTPIDFAYLVHSAVGNRMVGARVNDKLVPIDYRLHSGDRVEVVTSQNSRGPSRDWLKMVASTQARNKINQWFRSQNKEENIDRGRELMARYCESKGIDLPELTTSALTDIIIRKYGFREWEAVLAAVGHGGLKEGQVVNKLLEEKKKQDKKNITDEQVLQAVSEVSKKATVRKEKNGIIVEGIDDVAVHMARCCSPIPGDEIVGFITRGRGITIHRTDCINIIHLPEIERSRLIDADWHMPEEGGTEKYLVEINIYGNDRIGFLADVSRTLSEENIQIQSLTTRVSKQGTVTTTMSFETGGVEETNHVIARLRQVDSVLDIQRSKSNQGAI